MLRPGPAAGTEAGNRKNRFLGLGPHPASSIFQCKQLPGGLQDPRSRGDKVQQQTGSRSHRPASLSTRAGSWAGRTESRNGLSCPALSRLERQLPGGTRRRPPRRPFPSRVPPLTYSMCWSPPGATATVPGPRVPCSDARGPTCLKESRSPPHPAWLRTPWPGGKQKGGADSGQTLESSGTDASSLSPAWRCRLAAPRWGQRVRNGF